MAIIDGMLAKALKNAQAKFGIDKTYVASDHEIAVPVVECPVAWSYLIGGWDGMPVSGNLGCDGLPGHYKSTLALEHARWILKDGGVVIRTDNEERTSPSLVSSLMSDLTWEQRGRMLHEEVSSVEGWQDRVTFWLKQAMDIIDYAPEDRAVLFHIVDSLTGRGTRGEEKAIKTEGHAEERGYSGSAMSIARFYKSLSYRGALYTLFHVQHAKPSLDQYAPADEKLVASGGHEPRFNSRYHFRVLRMESIDCQDYLGREMLVRCVRSSLGTDKRNLAVRIIWWYEWRHMPVYDTLPGGEDGQVIYAMKKAEGTMTPDEAIDWWNSVNPHIPRQLAEQLAGEMHVFEWQEWTAALTTKTAELSELNGSSEKLSAAKTKQIKALEKELEDLDKSRPSAEIIAPLTEPRKVQITKFDWDYSIGWIFADELDNGYKKGLEDFLSEDRGFPGLSRTDCNKGQIKCLEVFGDKNKHSFTEFGAAVRENPDALKRVKALLGLEHRVHYRDTPSRSGTDGGKAPKEKKKK